MGATVSIDEAVRIAQSHQGAGRAMEAEGIFRKVLEVQPANVPSLIGMATLCQSQSRIDEGIDYCFRLAEVQPRVLEPLILASDFARSFFRFDAVDRCVSLLVERVADADPADWRALSSLYYRSLFMTLPQPVLRRLETVIDIGLQAEVARQGGPLPPTSPGALGGRRLRIGYMSANFGNHPIGQVTLSLFSAHDRAAFETTAFWRASPRADDPYAQTHLRAFARNLDVSRAPAREIAAAIRQSGIDILVCLDGHMDKVALEVLTFRPAPIQVYWLGHAGGLGLSSVDYLIADGAVVPPGEEALYQERIVRLPDVYHCADRPPIGDPGTRRDWGLPEDAPVFCGFNSPEKIDRKIFESWMRILAAVPGSVLWLTNPGGLDLRASSFRTLAERAGISSNRIIFAGRVADKAVHLARHRHATIFLDTITLTASTTALDALYAGLPIIAVRGRTFPARISNTMLGALGLDDLIMDDLAAYEARAIALARDPVQAATLKDRLAAAVETQALFKPDRFCRNLEAAYRAMWTQAATNAPAYPSP